MSACTWIPLLLALASSGQSPKASPDVARMQRRIRDAKTPALVRETELRRFLGRYAGALEQRDERALRVHLAMLALANRRPRVAQDEFRRIERSSSPKDRDLRAQCKFGLAQAAEILGRDLEAIRRYDEVYRAFIGSRYARLSKQASLRLRTVQRRGNGTKFEFPVRQLTVDGRRPPRLSGATVICLLGNSKRAPEAIRSVLRGAQGPRVVLFAEGEAAKEWAKRLAASPTRARSFVFAGSPRILGLATVPTWLVVGEDGRVLDVNPSRAELATLGPGR